MNNDVMTNSLIINALIVIGLTGFFAWRGYENGVIRTVQRLVSALSGYAACYFFTDFVEAQLNTWLGLHGVVNFIVSGLLLFVVFSMSVHWSLNLLIDWFEARDQEPARVPGLMIGAFLGCTLGLITVWIANIAMDTYQLRKEGPASFQGRLADPVRKAAGDAVGGAVGFFIEHKSGGDKLTSTIVARLVSDPVGVVQQLATVSRSDKVKHFFSDTTVQQLMTDNQFAQLQAHPAFHDMMSVPESREVLDLLATTVNDSEKLSQDERTARLLADLWQKAQRLKNDPRYLQLSQKPEFQQLAANPSPAALLTNPALQELGEIIFSEHPPLQKSAINSVQHMTPGEKQIFEAIQKPEWEVVGSTTTSDATAEKPGAIIYRWTDERGHRHFSEQKPDGQYDIEATPVK